MKVQPLECIGKHLRICTSVCSGKLLSMQLSSLGILLGMGESSVSTVQLTPCVACVLQTGIA